jgi:hypothetical protein
MPRETDAADSLGNEGSPEADRHLAENFGMTVRQVRDFDPQTLDVTRACKFLGLPLKRFDQLAAQPDARARWVETVARERKDLIELFPQAGKELKEMLEAIRKFALRKCMKPDGPALVDGGGTARSKARSADKKVSTQNLVIGGGVLAAVVLVGGIVAVVMSARGGPEKQASAPTGGDPGRAVQVDTQATKPVAVEKDSGEFPKAGGIAGGERERWTPLFNGKDLTGWTSSAGANSKWQVNDGAVTCTGPTDYLYTDRNDYGNFHLRVEAKINAAGNSGIYFRSGKPTATGKSTDGHYEAQISTRTDQPKTGTLFGLVTVEEVMVPPDTWFTYEVLAKGPRVQILVNGKQTVDYSETKPDRPNRGHIAIQCWKHSNAETVVAFRKVEIMELPVESKPVVVAGPFQVNSVWKAGQLVLTVTALQDERFTATFKREGNVFERIVSGTMKDGKISWQSKDVRSVSGGVGGNYDGTLGRDKDGDKIDFTWQDSKGETGTFTLRLNKEQVGKSVPAPPRIEDLIGVWDSDFGKVTLETNKSGVVSGYWIQGINKKGKITGGTFTPGTRKLNFSITQPWNNEKGSATFTLSADGTKLDGSWKHSSGNGTWQMTRSVK